MRLNYISYVVAAICFLFAAIAFAITPAYISDTTIGYTLTVVLAVLGLILAGVGYSQGPKETKLPSSEPSPAPEPTPTPVQQAQQVQQAQIAVSAPKPITATAPEEPEKPQEEVKPEKKAVRRRRKKA